MRTFCLLLCLALPSCRREAPEEIETHTAVAVAVETAKRDAIREVIAASGIVTPAPGAELIVTAPEAARIAELRKAEGDRVREGDVLVRFDIPALAKDAAASRAEVQEAQARHEHAKAASVRVQGLFERGIAAKKEVEDAQREEREAQAAVARAESGSGAAQAMAARAVVRAQFSGIVANRWHNPGDLVEPGQGDPILRVIDPSRLEVTAAVPVAALTRIVLNAPARVIDPAADAPIPATVVARPAAVDPASATANIRLSMPKATPFAAGLPVRVEILGPEHRGAIVVPPAAILNDGGKSIVMIVGADGKAHRHEVEVGVTSREQTEIKSGVAEGDKVIVRGHNGLPDNAAVTIAP